MMNFSRSTKRMPKSGRKERENTVMRMTLQFLCHVGYAVPLPTIAPVPWLMRTRRMSSCAIGVDDATATDDTNTPAARMRNGRLRRLHSI